MTNPRQDIELLAVLDELADEYAAREPEDRVTLINDVREAMYND